MFLLVSMTSNMRSTQYHEVMIYRKFPNYKMLALGSFLLSIEGFLGGITLYASLKKGIKTDTKHLMTLLMVGGLAAWPFLNQLSNYKKRKKPVLIINEKGLWYDGIWFKRNIFWSWSDIKNITWQVQESGFISMDYFTIRSHSHFPFIINAWNLDMPAKEIWEHINYFSKD